MTGRVLAVAPDLHSPTGATPVLLATAGGRWGHTLFRGRDALRRREELRALAAASDVVHWHVNLLHYAVAAEEARRLRGQVPQVATVHHVAPGEEDKVRLLEGLVDRIHVPSEDTRRAVAALVPDVPVVPAPYVVDLDVRPARPGPGRPLVVGWCGTARPGDRKRLDVLVAALVAARAEGHDVRLRVQGDVAPALVAGARERGLPVDDRGWARWRHRRRFYDGLDLYASASVIEGGPLPVLEAAAAAVPVATTEVGLAADLVAAGGARPLPADDVDGQAAVVAAVAAAPDERAERGAAGRRAVVALAGAAAVAAYDDLYDGLAGGRGGEPGDATGHNTAELRRDRAHEGHQLVAAGHRAAGARAVLAALPGLSTADRRWAISRLVRRRPARG